MLAASARADHGDQRRDRHRPVGYAVFVGANIDSVARFGGGCAAIRSRSH
jgi:hypothetical protein